MRLIKILIIIFFVLLPYSCSITKINKTKYPKDSKWIYYDGINDSTVVYIAYHSIFGKIYIKDSLDNSKATAVGWVEEQFLLPAPKPPKSR
jgi:hypothetical protein